MSEELFYGLAFVGLSALFILPFFLRFRRKERATQEAATIARAYGLHEPGTLHPVVDPARCIGTSACVGICPEGDVIGIQGGQAVAVSPACCIGHGLCERVCPMEAIQLVFGTSKRGVDIPRVQGNYETNVPGIFVIGELGGMGLIRNAFEQGRQCVEGIAARKPAKKTGVLDLVIVGCGPAGLAASLVATQKGLDFATIEREADLGGTVRHYPRKKLVMSSPVRLPGLGKIGALEMTKEDLIETWTRLASEANLEIRTGEVVEAITPQPDGTHEVSTSNGTLRAHHVVLAIGRRGLPRKLGVDGEHLPKVYYSLLEPESFQEEEILVVGGGDSAVEAALALAEQPGTNVHISYRRDTFSRVKPKNRHRLDEAVASGEVGVLFSTQVTEIREDTVTLANGDGPVQLPNHRLFVFIGGVLPTPFLESCGIEIDTKFGTP